MMFQGVYSVLPTPFTAQGEVDEPSLRSVVDLFLTDISGFQVIRDIRNLQPRTPILLITAHGSPQVFAEAKRLGAIGALSKPFPPAEILQLINSHLHGPTP